MQIDEMIINDVLKEVLWNEKINVFDLDSFVTLTDDISVSSK